MALSSGFVIRNRVHAHPLLSVLPPKKLRDPEKAWCRAAGAERSRRGQETALPVPFSHYPSQTDQD